MLGFLLPLLWLLALSLSVVAYSIDETNEEEEEPEETSPRSRTRRIPVLPYPEDTRAPIPLRYFVVCAPPTPRSPAD